MTAHNPLLTGSHPSNVYPSSRIFFERQAGIKTLAGLLPRLEEVGGVIELNNMDDLVSLDGAFPALKSAMSIRIGNCRKLLSLAGAFPALESVTQRIEVLNNELLDSAGTIGNPSFKSMAPGATEDLWFIDNGQGGSGLGTDLSFCNSAKGQFCGIAKTYGATRFTNYYDRNKQGTSSTCC